MSEFALHLVVEDVPAAVDFYRRAFGARLTRELHLPDGSIATADLLLEGPADGGGRSDARHVVGNTTLDGDIGGRLPVHGPGR